MITIDQAITDRNLLGAALGDLASWRTWIAVLKGAFGLTLNRQDRRAFDAVAQRKSPLRRVRELWSLVGRRSGKSRVAALIAVFVACFVPHNLAAGEIGTVLVLSPSRDQARVVFNYALGALRASPVLAQEIAGDPQIATKFKPFSDAIFSAVESFNTGTPKVREFVDEVARIGLQNPAVQELAAKLIKSADDAASFELKLKQVNDQLKLLNGGTLSGPDKRGLGIDNSISTMLSQADRAKAQLEGLKLERQLLDQGMPRHEAEARAKADIMLQEVLNKYTREGIDLRKEEVALLANNAAEAGAACGALSRISGEGLK